MSSGWKLDCRVISISLAMAVLAACVPFERVWTLEPNSVGVSTGHDVARYTTSTSEGDVEVARAELAPYGIAVPTDVDSVVVEHVDFEGGPGVVVRDAVVVRLVVSSSAVDAVLDAPRTGLHLGLTGNSVANSFPPEIRDMIGVPIDDDAPAMNVPLGSREPGIPDTTVALAVPAGDPAMVTIVLYEIVD